MIQKPTLICDIDGVVADLNHAWLRRYNQEYEDSLTADRIKTWNIHSYVKPECGTEIYKYLHARDLYDEVPPIPGALEGIRKLREKGYHIFFATSSPMTSSGRKAFWLEEHGFLKLNHGGFTNEYAEIHSKWMLRGDAMLDDAVHNLEHFEGQKLLFDACHNQQNPPFLCTRVMNWHNIENIIHL